MGYIQIYRSYKKNIIAMGFFVAWLWAFPLFGVLQANLSYHNNEMLTFNIFNLLFLTGNALGFLTGYFVKNKKLMQSLTFCSPIVNIILTTGIGLICWLRADFIETQQHFLISLLYIFLPLLMYCYFFYFMGYNHFSNLPR